MGAEQKVNVAEYMAIVNFDITSTVQGLGVLVNAALATASKSLDFDPGTVLQVILSADQDIVLTDPNTEMTLNVASGIEKRIPSKDALQMGISTASTATGTVEIYKQDDVAL